METTTSQLRPIIGIATGSNNDDEQFQRSPLIICVDELLLPLKTDLK